MLQNIIIFIIGYVIGMAVHAWNTRRSIDLSSSKGIRFYYRPDTELVEKLEVFYTNDSFDDEKLKKCKVFFDRER